MRVRRRIHAVLLTALLLGAGGIVSGAAQANPAPQSEYVFTTFTYDSESDLHIYRSSDALNFEAPAGPAYTPSDSLLRDPSIIRHRDGRYYVVHTTGWDTTNFAIAVSNDLQSWQHLTTVSVPVAGIHNTWAPEFFVDPVNGSVNVIVSLGAEYRSSFRPYLFTALDSSLRRWGPPAALPGIEPNYIDTFVTYHQGEYHAFAKNETDKRIEHAVAPRLGGPYEFVQTGDFAGWGRAEGPAITELPDGRYRIYMDAYTSDRFLYSDSADLYEWTAPRELPGGLSGFVRHGTVLRLN
ncbi:glycoside hydrolase family 43 protein [Actinoalloteichus hymeniacidonis]|uniref:Glycosyl hydrolase family 43 n=1 Tax=Actinoalloteichus hymeniacidonis TaxID=340345 RepID=A0AAC9HKQ1_9PSEU|nr:glycoside hydrolase family 43 protein [Actinoalloteichus hymeniacidonis]AOS61054.1 glycosyl hydrolase family 43 [Actinoalloteichus hymeniacidonis]MBB5910946.1 hypothetical protein [Actinoalloteichus hymeniacidonis]